MASKTTLADVAAKAGVSKTTASMILNDRNAAQFSEVTRRRVANAAHGLNYAGAGGARQRPAMPNNAANAICFLHPEKVTRDADGSNYIAAVLDGVQAEAYASGYRVNIATGLADSMPSDRYLREMLNGQAQGILVGGRLEQEHIELVDSLDIPSVVVGDITIPEPGRHVVYGDNYMGGRLAAEHLLSLGHQHIAFVGFPTLRTFYQQRLAGMVQAMLCAGINIDRRFICDLADPDDLADVLDRLLALPQPPTAIFAPSMRLGLACHRHLAQRGVKIPQQMSLVGYDNPQVFNYLSPPMTSVDVSREAIGRLGFQKLMDLIRYPEVSHALTLVPTSLVVRQSTAAAP